jgi:hypothetical protein
VNAAKAKQETTGFGCPKTVDPHHFVVELPRGRTAPVVIAEAYGIKAGINGLPEIDERCQLPYMIWRLIAEDLKREFNERLRSKKMTTGRWTTGLNKIERLLGKELLVLAWAVERADSGTVPNAIRNWIGLRPEERWWLYTVTAAATGGLGDADIGWRKALRIALTENPLAEITHIAPPKRSRLIVNKAAPSMQQGFFGFENGEQSPFMIDDRHTALEGGTL